MENNKTKSKIINDQKIEELKILNSFEKFSSLNFSILNIQQAKKIFSDYTGENPDWIIKKENAFIGVELFRLSRHNKSSDRVSSHMYVGAKLYYGDGPDKMFVGEILGGNEKYTDPYTGKKYRGVKLKMKSGRAEWKDRKAILLGPWYVKKNDPALRKMEWFEYAN